MQRSAIASMSLLRNNRNQIIQRILKPGDPPCDVFINHRGKDTKRNVASLLYDRLHRMRVRPFLDNKSMKPGDKLFDKIDAAIKGCKIGVAVFSPNYCDSYFCLHELALMMETKKKMIPIFCDVKPSDLHVVEDRSMAPDEVGRFRSALEEAKYTMGLNFDSRKENWSDVVKKAADIVVESLMEIDDGEEDEDEDEEGMDDDYNHFIDYTHLQNSYIYNPTLNYN